MYNQRQMEKLEALLPEIQLLTAAEETVSRATVTLEAARRAHKDAANYITAKKWAALPDARKADAGENAIKTILNGAPDTDAVIMRMFKDAEEGNT